MLKKFHLLVELLQHFFVKKSLLAKQFFIKESTASPNPNQFPSSNKGYMILVEAKSCKYGSKCYRECWSVTSYSQGGEYYKKGEHKPVHWHIARDAKWTLFNKIHDFVKKDPFLTKLEKRLTSQRQFLL